MAKSYTTNFKKKVNATSGDAPVTLLEITHSLLVTPVRVVNDNQDIVSSGVTFTAFGFSLTLPDDISQQIPRARITLDNVGRELTQWIDASQGGRGAQVRVMQVMRNTPNVLEFDITLDLLNVRQNLLQISGELGFDNTLNIAALPMTYRPEVTPELF
jgi:hypothetical protein